MTEREALAEIRSLDKDIDRITSLDDSKSVSIEFSTLSHSLAAAICSGGNVSGALNEIFSGNNTRRTVLELYSPDCGSPEKEAILLEMRDRIVEDIVKGLTDLQKMYAKRL